MFQNREDAARHLARKLRGRPLRSPLVLGIPRGGVILGAVLATELEAELDVVIARKLRTPGAPEVAMGALSETGEIYLNPEMKRWIDTDSEAFQQECRCQREEIARRGDLLRTVCLPVSHADRSIILTDDGIATGSTMIAALQVVRAQCPRELIVAVPVASPDRLAEVAHHCDAVVCLLAPENFRGVGAFYEDFHQVEDEDVLELLRQFAPSPARAAP